MLAGMTGGWTGLRWLLTALYVTFAVLPSVLLGLRLAAPAGRSTPDGRQLTYLGVADLVLTAGIVLAWTGRGRRRLGVAVGAFAAGFGILVTERLLDRHV
jgi:hypothetical protein